MDLLVATPVNPDKFSDFLRREREALLKRREILKSNNPSLKDALIEEEDQTDCQNATFTSQREIVEAGYRLSQCFKTSESCDENCACQKICDVQGQCKEKCSSPNQIEECVEENLDSDGIQETQVYYCYVAATDKCPFYCLGQK